MHTPKVKFTNIPISKEINWMYGFLFQDEWGWGKYIIRKHPKIKKVFFYKNKVDRVKFLKQYIIQLRKDNFKTIERNKNKYQKQWQKIEKDFFKISAEIIEINWPKKRKVIQAMVSINPICPRFLSDWSFFLSYDRGIKGAMEIIMHECCHFLYFEKWKKLYPKMSPKKFESPYIEWHLSEILAPVILNDPRIQKLLKQKAGFYEEYKRIYINKKIAPEYFNLLYKEYLKEQSSFEDFLQGAYREIKKHKNKFKKL